MASGVFVHQEGGGSNSGVVFVMGGGMVNPIGKGLWLGVVKNVRPEICIFPIIVLPIHSPTPPPKKGL